MRRCRPRAARHPSDSSISADAVTPGDLTPRPKRTSVSGGACPKHHSSSALLPCVGLGCVALRSCRVDLLVVPLPTSHLPPPPAHRVSRRTLLPSLHHLHSSSELRHLLGRHRVPRNRFSNGGLLSPFAVARISRCMRILYFHREARSDRPDILVRRKYSRGGLSDHPVVSCSLLG